jgi:hypothetical protein
MSEADDLPLVKRPERTGRIQRAGPNEPPFRDGGI